MKWILGKKIGMTQVFRDDGNVVPVTRVVAGPCLVTAVRTLDNATRFAVQLGFGSQKTFRLSQAELGHLRGLSISGQTGETVRSLKEHVETTQTSLKRGDLINTTLFAIGERVEVTGQSKGKGFQGVVKRHGFAGGPASHGHKDNLRMPGSIGATGPQRVFKGVRMGGHMGDEQVTVKNLEIVKILPDENELWIKGALPGATGGLLKIVCPQGEMKVAEKMVEESEVVVNENPVEPTPVVEEVSEPMEEIAEVAETPAPAEEVAEVVEEAPAPTEETKEETKTEEN